MDFAAFKEVIIRVASEQRIAEYELYYQASESTSVGTFKQEINQFTASTEGGVCFRCIVDGQMGYASTESLTEEQAESLVLRAAENARTLESEDPVFMGEGGQVYQPLERKCYDMPATEELIQTALDTQAKLYAVDPMVIDGTSTRCIAEKESIAIYNSKGLDLSYENTLSAVVANAVVTNGKEMANDYGMKVGQLKTLDLDEMTSKAVKTAITQLDGDVAPTGNYPVVFSPEAMANLLQTFGVIFDAERAQKGLSRLAGQEGTKIASDLVTLVDDPFYKDSPAPINFDAEGSPTYCKHVIEAGVLTTLLHNLKTAAVAGKTTTGNASKAGYNAPISIRPFTMYIAPGSMTEAEVFAKAGNGVYITSLGGLHAGANAISGDFSLQSSGYLIENGEKTTYVKSFTVAGNFYDVLKNIVTVADNLKLPGASGMTAFGSPSVLVEGLSVAGK